MSYTLCETFTLWKLYKINYTRQKYNLIYNVRNFVKDRNINLRNIINIVINQTASTMDILLRIFYMEVYVF